MIEKIQLILTGFLVVISFPVIGYFLHREFTLKDKGADAREHDREALQTSMQEMSRQLNLAMHELTAAVGELKVALEETRRWSLERFVTQPDHERDLKGVYVDIERQAQHFKEALAWCSKHCPAKRVTVEVPDERA